MGASLLVLKTLILLGLFDLVTNQICDEGGHVTVSNPRRSALATLNETVDTALCDFGIDENAWFRFDSYSGTAIVERDAGDPVPMQQCGTQIPIYISGVGSHPVTDNSTVNATVCANYAGNACNWMDTIQIYRCPAQGNSSSFYLYKLKSPPGCSMAYCAGDKNVCDRGYYWTGSTCVNHFPVMTGFPIFSGPCVNGSEINQQIYFSCKVQYVPQSNDSKARFRVTFLFDGQTLDVIAVVGKNKPVERLDPITLTSDSDLVVILDELHLRGRLGREISCLAESYWEDNGPDTMSMMSAASFYAQFESDATSYSVNLTKGSTFNVTFKSTLPFTCLQCAGLKNDVDRTSCCQYTFRMENTASSPHCIMVWTGGDTLVVTVYFVPQSAKTGGSFALVFQQFNDDEKWGGKALWRDYTIPQVSMNILPQPITYKHCITSGDPHLITFDDVSFNNYMLGDFYLVKAVNVDQLMEVQVRHESCNGGKVTCNCAVAVREGNSVYRISVCEEGSWSLTNQRRPTVFRLLAQDPADASAVYKDGTGYKFSVRMPSGLRVEVDFTAPWSSVSVYLPPEYHGKTDSASMCGNSNNNRGDDCGDLCDDSNTNLEKFRVPAHLSHFSHQPNCSNIFNVNATRCGCNNTYPVCSNTDPLIKTLTSSNFPFDLHPTVVCNQSTQSSQRKRRDVSSSSLYDSSDAESDSIPDDDVLFPPYTYDPNFGVNVSFTWPTPKGKTEQEVNQNCSDMLISSPAYSDCSSNVNLSTIIAMCVSDIQIADDWIPVSAYTHVFEQSCLNNIVAKVTNISDSTYTALVLTSGKICPNQCSGRGSCSDGTCTCNTGYIGADCSIDQSLPPSLDGMIRKGLCDVRKRPCAVISVYGSGVAFSSALKCRFTDQNTGDQEETSGTFVTAMEYSCPVPETTTHRRRRSTTTRTTALSTRKVSITIDGVTYSNAIDFVIFDSVCMECNSTDTCQQKDDSCLISGECFADKAVKPDDPCLQCVPSVSTNSWTNITVVGDWGQCTKDCTKTRSSVCGTTVKDTEDQVCNIQDCHGGGVKFSSLSYLLMTLALATFVLSLHLHQL